MARGNWHMVTPTVEFLRMWRTHNPPEVEPPSMYENAHGLSALVGREPFDNAGEDWRWHISVRYGDPGRNGRVPHWDELVRAAHDLRPGVVFVVGIPPRSWWMNVHPHVLHLHETNDELLVEQYRSNAMDQVPT